MISYPVKIEPYGNVYIIEDSNNYVLARVSVVLPSGENSLAVANTIVNALNAMNEFPIVAVGSSWINEVLVSWSRKFFPEYNIHHTKERDCLCEECADV